MAKLILHISPDLEKIEARRLQEDFALTPKQRMQKAYMLMSISELFRKKVIRSSGKDYKSRTNPYEEKIDGFLNELGKQQVRFILVGGLAVNFYGYSRATPHVDIWIEDSEKNRTNLVLALSELRVDDAFLFRKYQFVPGISDVLLYNEMYVKFMDELQFLKQPEFNKCYNTAKIYTTERGIKVPVLHIDDLLDEKQKSKSLKDKCDAEKLIELYRKR